MMFFPRILVIPEVRYFKEFLRLVSSEVDKKNGICLSLLSLLYLKRGPFRTMFYNISSSPLLFCYAH